MKKHLIIKYFPLSLYDVDNTFQFGVEMPIPKSRFSVQQEGGYGHSSTNLWYLVEGDRPDKDIVKSRTQLRFYFYERSRVRSYVAGEYLFKRITNSDTQWVGKDCANGDCGYFEIQNVKFGRFVNAGHVKAGWQFYFPHRMTVDIFAGFGVRSVNVRTLTPGAERATLNDNLLFWGAGFNSTVPYTEVIPSLSLGFSIGFALGRFKSDPARRAN